jgi:hypothetical protein
MAEMNQDQWPLTRGSLVYPLPIAVACGRVLRARTASERVSACLKAAEVLARYLAAVATASFATRAEEGKVTLSELSGNLSFGHFLTTVQQVAAAKVEHPAAALLALGFKKTKRNQESLRGKTDAALVALLELRNDLGHELRSLDEAKAAAIDANGSPLAQLLKALDGVEILLSKPLFVVENQEWTREALIVRRLLLMGESSDPTPQFIKVARDAGVECIGTPYIAIDKTCLQLPPWLLWGIDHNRQNFALLFLDAVDGERVRYRTIDGSEQHRGDGTAAKIRELYSGARKTPDTVVLIDGRDLAREWTDTRERIEESGRRQDGLVDWRAFDQPTVSWFAGLLAPGNADPHATIRERLLDGRFHVEPDELRQLRLLFGRPAAVRSELQRDVLDLRVIDPSTQRPSQRDLVESANLLEALKRAIRFFAAHTGMAEVAPEDLTRTEGSVDYITLREIFVNQAVHQDYQNSTAAAQIEIHPSKVTVFNAGYSLVAPEKLLDGGKSQSRNPLIARALRSIGFAEIAGSGIRAVHRACQQARRKAPTFESDRDANTFALTLDWSEGGTDVDNYWQTLVGVHLTERQTSVLNVVVGAPSVTIGVIETATGLTTEDVIEALDFLVIQVLVEQDESNYRLAQHLREKLG